MDIMISCIMHTKNIGGHYSWKNIVLYKAHILIVNLITGFELND